MDSEWKFKRPSQTEKENKIKHKWMYIILKTCVVFKYLFAHGCVRKDIPRYFKKQIKLVKRK